MSKKGSTGKVSAHCPKYQVSENSFPTNTTQFAVNNKLGEPVFVNVNGSLWNTTVNFQDQIPAGGSSNRQMPAGFKPTNFEVRVGGNCFRRDTIPKGNHTHYGLNINPPSGMGNTTRIDVSHNGTTGTVNGTTGAVNGTQNTTTIREAYNNITIGGDNITVKPAHQENCSLPDQRTSPFWLSQRPATLTKTAFIATPQAAAYAGLGFAAGMMLLAACIKCCAKPNTDRTPEDKKLSKDVTVKAKNSAITGEHQTLDRFIDHWLGQGYTVPSVSSQGQLFLHKPEGGPGMNLSKSFPNKGNSKGYAETGFCYALLQVSDGGEWPQPYFDDSEGWEQQVPSSAPSPSSSHENIELGAMGGNQGEDLDTDSLRELESLLGAAGGINPSPTLNLDLFGEWAARQDNR